MNNNAEQISRFEGLADIYRTSRTEYADATLIARTTMLTTLGGVAFEWSVGNEALLGAVGGSLHEATGNPAITALATGGTSFAEQMIFGSLMAATIFRFPRVADRVRQLARGDKDEATNRSSVINRFLGAFVLGSAVSVAKENAVADRSSRDNIRHVLASSAMIGAANTALVATASTLANVGSRHGFEAQADMAISVISNPLTYVALFAGKLGYDKLKKTMNIIRERRKKYAGLSI